MRITEKAKYDEYNRRTKIRTGMAEIDDGYEYIIGRNQKRFITSRVMRKVMNLIYIYNLCFCFCLEVIYMDSGFKTCYTLTD